MKLKSPFRTFTGISNQIVQTSLVILTSSLAANAATFTWDGGGADTKASNGLNWVGDAAPLPAGYDIVFSGTSTIGTTVNWDYAQNFRSLTFDSAALAYTIGGATPIQFITSGIDSLVNNSANTQTITDTVNLFFNGSKGFNTGSVAGGSLALTNVVFRADSMTTGQTNTLTLTGSNNGTISGTISRSGTFAGTATDALTKTGSGTWTLAGANSYQGLTTISGGTLKLGGAGSGANSPLGTITTGTTITAGNLDLNGFTLTTAEALTLNGTGVSSGGALSNSSATAATFSGLVTLGGNASIVSNLTNTTGNIILSNTGSITGAGFGLTLGGTTTGNSIASTIDTTTGGITKNNSGTWTLSGANTYTGTTAVANGTLVLSGNRTAASGGITVAGAGAAPTLSIQNGTFTLGGSFVIGQSASTSIVNQTAGTITATGGSQILLGNGDSTATYNLSGGSLTGGIRMGVNAAPTANVNVFNLSGTGSLTSSSLQIGRSDAAGSFKTTNTFNQTAGTATITNLSIGGATADAAVVSNISGTLNLTGGTFTATNFTSLSAGGSNTSAITIGGTAQVTLPAFPTARGTGSTATITFNGGTLLPAAASSSYLGGMTNAYLTSNGAKFDLATGKDITVSQLLENAASNAGTLTKLGVGTLTLSGSNSYTGATKISAGNLSIGSISNIGSSSPLGAGDSTSAATNTASLVFNGGKLEYTGGDATTDRGFTLTGSGAILLPTAGTDLIVSGNITGAQTLTLGTATTLVGSTSSLKLSGNNSGFTGNVVVNNGNLIITSNDSLGTGTKTVQVLVNSTGVASLSLDGSAADITLPSSISFTTSLGGVGAGIVNIAGNNTINGNFSMTGGNGGTQFVSNGGSLTLAGNISATTTTRAVFLQGTAAGTVSGVISDGLTVNMTVTKSDPGSWSLSGANTYSGATVISAGKLAVGSSSNVIPNGDGKGNVVLDGGATTAGVLDLNNFNETINGLSGTGGAALGQVVNNSSSALKTLTVGDGNATAGFAGVIKDNTSGTGTIALTKIGTGTQTLLGANTYTGATQVNAGTLLIGTSASLGATAVTVGGASATGAPTLAGGGTIGGAAVIAAADGGVAGIHSPGVTGVSNGVGTQTFSGTLNYASGSIFEWDFNATPGVTAVAANAATGTYDQVVAAGAITGTAAIFKLVLSGNTFANDFWNTDKSWTNIFSGAGTPANLAAVFSSFSATGGLDSSGFVSGRGQFTFNGTSSTLNWTAVPEPTSALAGILIGAGLLRRRRAAK